MTERDVCRRLLLAFQADEDVAGLTEAAYYKEALASEVEDAAVRAHANWVELASAVAELERNAQKRVMAYLTKSAA